MNGVVRASKRDREQSRDLAKQIKELEAKFPQQYEKEKKILNDQIPIARKKFEEAREIGDELPVTDPNSLAQLAAKCESLNSQKRSLKSKLHESIDKIEMEIERINEPFCWLLWRRNFDEIQVLNRERRWEEVERYRLGERPFIKIRHNFDQVRAAQQTFLYCNRKIRDMRSSASLDEIEKVFLEMAESIPVEFVPKEESEYSEMHWLDVLKDLQGVQEGAFLIDGNKLNPEPAYFFFPQK